MFRRLHDERGVAMTAVILIGAALTVTASAGSFVAIQELRASTDDRKAAGALAYAEAGLDQMIQEIRANLSWGRIRLAGCEGVVTNGTAPLEVAGTIGSGSYSASLEVYKESTDATQRYAPAACSGRSSSPKNPQKFVVTSAGSHPSAKRIIRQIVTIQAKGLPIGIFADAVDGNGNVSMNSLSLVSPNNIIGRDKIAFAGRDPYYTLNDFYPGQSATEQIPAAAHAVGEIRLSTGQPSKRIEHKSPGANPNCAANPLGQSLWDGSKWGATISTGCAGQPIAGGTTTRPPTTLFTTNDLARVTPKPALSDQDYLALKEAARSSGLYCYIPVSGSASCLKEGVATPYKAVWNTGDVPTTPTYITYFEFEGGDPNSNTVKFKANVGPCSYDQDLNRSTILIVRNGSLSMQSGAVVTGAVIVPEGSFDSEGNFTTHGTIIANEFWLRGTANFQMSQCWVDNMPTGFLDVKASKWSEVDR